MPNNLKSKDKSIRSMQFLIYFSVNMLVTYLFSTNNFNKMISRVLVFCILLSLTSAEVLDRSLLSMVSRSGMKYDQIMAWSDFLWVEVEGGRITPRQAEETFLEETGMPVLDFLVGSGEIQLAVEEGLIDQSIVNSALSG